MLIEILFLVILAGVMFTLFHYSQEGDILTFTGNAPKVREMREKYVNREQIVERLHSLLVYKESYVRWNREMIIALFVSLVILYCFRSEIRLAEVLLLTTFVFLAIDLPNRWGHAHISASVIQEGTQLYTLYGSLPSN